MYFISHWIMTDENDGNWWSMDDFTENSPVDCDLNRDGAITSAYLGIAFANLGLTGD